MNIDETIAERLNELRLPHACHLVDFPEQVQALTDRLNEFIRGWPMMVTAIPTQDGREVLRIETQDINNSKIRNISYVWPRPNQ